MGNEQSSPSRGGSSSRRNKAGGSPGGESDGSPLSPDNSSGSALSPQVTSDSQTLGTEGSGTGTKRETKSVDFAKLASEGAHLAAEVGRVGFEKTRELADSIQNSDKKSGGSGGRRKKGSKRSSGGGGGGGMDDVLDSVGGLCTTFSTVVLGGDDIAGEDETHQSGARRHGSRRGGGRYESEDDETRYSDEDSRGTYGTYGDSTYATEDNRRFRKKRSGMSDDLSYDDATFDSRYTNDETLDTRLADDHHRSRGGGGGRRSKYKSNSYDEDDTYAGGGTYDETSRVGSSIISGGHAAGGAAAAGKENLANGPPHTPGGNSALTDRDHGLPTSGIKQPLASSFAKRCYFTKSGIGKTTQHYEGLTLTGNVVLMLASAMKLKGCPTICDEDLRRVEQTYPNQFSRLPDELLLSSGWRRISKYCHFSNRPIPDGIPFFHSKSRCHPQTGGYYFLLAAAVGMVRPIDVEPLNHDTLVVLQTDYPIQCDAAVDAGGDAANLIEDPTQWTLVNKFCFFSGGPINTDEDVYYRATLDGNEIYMLAFLSPSLTPEELYRLGRRVVDSDGTVRYEKIEKAAGAAEGAKEEEELTSVQAVMQVESVYDLTERDFADLRLYHLGPCRALPGYLLKPEAWTKVVPPHFVAAKEEAMKRAKEYEERFGVKPAPVAPTEPLEQPQTEATPGPTAAAAAAAAGPEVPQSQPPQPVIEQEAVVPPPASAAGAAAVGVGVGGAAVAAATAASTDYTNSAEPGVEVSYAYSAGADGRSVGTGTAFMTQMEGGMLPLESGPAPSPGHPDWEQPVPQAQAPLQPMQAQAAPMQQAEQQPVFPPEAFPDPFANQSMGFQQPPPQQEQQSHVAPPPTHGYVHQQAPPMQQPTQQQQQAYAGQYQYSQEHQQMEQAFGTPFYTAQALSQTAAQGQLGGYGEKPMSPPRMQAVQQQQQQQPPPMHSALPDDERARQLRREVEEEGAFGAVGGEMPLDEALDMSREEPSAPPTFAKAEESEPMFAEESPVLATDPKAYDDPPLEQPNSPDNSVSVESNPWRGEDPPEEYRFEDDVPHDELEDSGYDDDEMPDDEMTGTIASASRASTNESAVREDMSEDPTSTSEVVDRYGVIEHQDGFGEAESHATYDSRGSRGTRNSIAASLKERYRGKRSPGVPIPSSPPGQRGSASGVGLQSKTGVDAPSATALSHDPPVNSPGSSEEVGYARSPEYTGSPGYSQDFISGEEFSPKSGEDGYYYEEGPGEEEEAYSKDDYQSYDVSVQSDSQFSPTYTDGDEIMSPLGSPTTAPSQATYDSHSTEVTGSNARGAEELQRMNREKRQIGLAQWQSVSEGGTGTPQTPHDTLGEGGDEMAMAPLDRYEESPQPSPSVSMSPQSETGSYTTSGSYTTDASSIISAEANPSARRALILQMAKARMNSGKRREQEESAGMGGSESSGEEEGPSNVTEKGEAAVKMAHLESLEEDEEDGARPLSPGSDVVIDTGDLD